MIVFPYLESMNYNGNPNIPIQQQFRGNPRQLQAAQMRARQLQLQQAAAGQQIQGQPGVQVPRALNQRLAMLKERGLTDNDRRVVINRIAELLFQLSPQSSNKEIYIRRASEIESRMIPQATSKVSF